jgi:hypothetical protein
MYGIRLVKAKRIPRNKHNKHPRETDKRSRMMPPQSVHSGIFPKADNSEQ